MSKTYGEKPIIFAFEENGEQYMIGSEVSKIYLSGILIEVKIVVGWELSEAVSRCSV